MRIDKRTAHLLEQTYAQIHEAKRGDQGQRVGQEDILYFKRLEAKPCTWEPQG